MKRGSIIALFLTTAFCANAQDWKKSATLSDGTVLNIGDSITINDVPSHTILKCIDVRDGYDGLSTVIYRRHLGAFMPRNTYAILEFSIVKSKSGTTSLAIISDKYADPAAKVEYIIYLEDAIKNGVVSVKTP